jgi:chromate transporter
MKEYFKKLFTLFITFFRIGAFTFGGGYAMIPIIKEEVVTKRHWMEDSDILDIVAIAESTPGPIAINTATFVGKKTAGTLGAAAATLGTVLPSFLIILAISSVLRQFEELTVVKYAFAGIRAAVLVLIFQGLLSMYKACPKGKMEYILMALSFFITVIFDVNVLFVIISCAVIGLCVSRWRERDGNPS